MADEWHFVTETGPLPIGMDDQPLWTDGKRDYTAAFLQYWIMQRQFPSFASQTTYAAWRQHLDRLASETEQWGLNSESLLGLLNTTGDAPTALVAALATVRRLEQAHAMGIPVTTKAKPRSNADIARDPAIEARDKWLYEQCCKLVVYTTIIKRLTRKPKNWPRIQSISGIKKAASIYAERHGLPPIPRRQRGRPMTK